MLVIPYPLEDFGSTLKLQRPAFQLHVELLVLMMARWLDDVPHCGDASNVGREVLATDELEKGEDIIGSAHESPLGDVVKVDGPIHLFRSDRQNRLDDVVEGDQVLGWRVDKPGRVDESEALVVVSASGHLQIDGVDPGLIRALGTLSLATFHVLVIWRSYRASLHQRQSRGLSPLSHRLAI